MYSLSNLESPEDLKSESGFAPISSKKTRNSNCGREFSFKNFQGQKLHITVHFLFAKNKRKSNFWTVDLNVNFFEVIGAKQLWLFKTSGL